MTYEYHCSYCRNNDCYNCVGDLIPCFCKHETTGTHARVGKVPVKNRPKLTLVRGGRYGDNEKNS
jgi:hypothetical protein